MNALGLATRGYLCCPTGPTVVTTLHPEVRPEDFEPEINTRETSAPRIVQETVHDLKPTIRKKPRKR